MVFKFKNGLEVLQTAQKENLYTQLLAQLKKDFSRANVRIAIDLDMDPKTLNALVQEKLYVLILEKFQEYLNLLYIVDISEREIKKLAVLDAVDASSQVGFLILKREWQKVWFKHKYNS
ncbi:hypothetical protein [Flagellimonas flava]|uniref:Uncharacterized protein n=1 Tax=Flagellimonas flava TaxID=570519 RepID=A0A1M5LRC4_9FLAO|nr:hypothetical protein [Allomuricauda flava]SHG67674.1 hypothetical protein SAMN04488116_2052 [Allomuricauda flava]